MSTGRLCIITGGNHFVIGRGGGEFLGWGSKGVLLESESRGV